MVLLSMLRQATTRKTLIKFRGRRGPKESYKALAAKGIKPPPAKADVVAPQPPTAKVASKAAPRTGLKAGLKAGPKAAPKAVPRAAPKAAVKPQQAKTKAVMTISKGPILEDWQLPAKYRRLPFDNNEIDYINCGGLPSLGLAKKPPPKKGAKKPTKPDAKKKKKK